MSSNAGGVTAMAMEGSTSADSYAHNSEMQYHNFHAVARPRLEKAIARLVGLTAASPSRRLSLAIADLGCSYGRNTIECAIFILQSLQRFSSAKQHTNQEQESEARMEVQYFFSDLPSNDFNALFLALQPHLLRQQSSVPQVYVAGVPGSFHGRLFPSASLDLAICSYSLHWLSQAPPSVTDRSSSSWNGRHIWIHNASKDVINAYTLQAKADTKSFIRSRASELKKGGILFLLLAGSKSMPKESVAYRDPIWEVFDLAWLQIVKEGIIKLEEMEMFNLPMFFLNQEHLERVVMEVPDFQILSMETMDDRSQQETLTLQQWLAFLASVIKPTVDSYLGIYKSNILFDRVKDIIMSRKNNFTTRFSHNLVVASLQRL